MADASNNIGNTLLENIQNASKRLPLSNAQKLLNAKNFTADEYGNGMFLLSAYELLQNVVTSNRASALKMIVEANWYFWDLYVDQTSVNWTVTPIYDNYYWICYNIDLPHKITTV